MSSLLERMPWLTAFGWTAVLMSFVVGFAVGLFGGIHLLMTVAAQLKG